MNVKWHAITDEDLRFSFKFTDEWVTNHVCPNDQLEFWARCHGALNWFIETQHINDDEMYCFMNDDDGYELEFFTKLAQVIDNETVNNGTSPNIVMVSMLRGHNIPAGVPANRQHHTNTLFAQPDWMKCGSVGLEQIVIRGKLLKNYRLHMHIEGDGRFIEQAVRENGAVYAPHIYALFNYFEPGRWNK